VERRAAPEFKQKWACEAGSGLVQSPEWRGNASVDLGLTMHVQAVHWTLMDAYCSLRSLNFSFCFPKALEDPLDSSRVKFQWQLSIYEQ
jgi:hypothetical protein